MIGTDWLACGKHVCGVLDNHGSIVTSPLNSLKRKKSAVTYLNSTMHPGTRKRGESF